jgi:hypothetical protein
MPQHLRDGSNPSRQAGEGGFIPSGVVEPQRAVPDRHLCPKTGGGGSDFHCDGSNKGRVVPAAQFQVLININPSAQSYHPNQQMASQASTLVGPCRLSVWTPLSFWVWYIVLLSCPGGGAGPIKTHLKRIGMSSLSTLPTFATFTTS